MRTVDYSDILRGSAGLAGMNYAPGDATSDVGTPEFRLFRTLHDRRLQKAWEIHRWPDLCPVEQRHYRQSYDAAENITATTERFHIGSGRYYQALRAQSPAAEAPATYSNGGWTENSAYWAECKNGYSGNDWVTGTAYVVGDQVRDPLTDLQYQVHTAHTAGATIDLTKMGLLTPFNKYIAYEQADETAIAEFFTLTDRDPRITTQVRRCDFWLSQDGAQVNVTAPAALWVYYRIRRVELKGEMFDADTVYTSGQQVYFVTSAGLGNFYTANATTTAGQSPETTAGKWDVVEIPYFLRGYLIEAGYADWLTANDQADEAAAHEGFAEHFLELEADKLQRQQQQVRRLQVAA